ncbi:MAG: hypothetical protein HYY57_02115 [Candidatus Omnitrophica bacterium]|nr:hypothetical protein [Candidatus Omnitrophota bacterium]
MRSIPSVTNFILFEIGPKATQIAEALAAKGVIVREMSAWKLTGYIRVTIGTKAENQRFLTALKSCLAAH